MRLRPGNSRDVATFARLINAQSQWLRSEDLWDEDELAAILISATGEPPDNDRYLEVGGETVAAVHVHMSEPFAKGTIHLALPPGPERAEHARTLLDAAARIVQSSPYTATDTALQMDVAREDTELLGILDELGFLVVQKETILEGEIFDAPAPAWPSDVDVSTLSVTRDLRDGYEVIREAFVPKLGGWHLSWDDYEYSVQNDPTALPGISIIVRDAEGPLAIALNFMDTTKASTGLTGLLGVRERRRSQGLGRALLLESFDRFRSRGWSHARLATVLGMDVDDDNYRLYTGVSMRPLFDNLVLARSRK
ncbi:MAG: GNAT family N-acetyltransferase [Actinomycetia bacterium]|nr:GNAT family N-acetyltransferase [Actinomycetes bacterium]